MKPPSIVIVESESETRDALMMACESRGYMTWTCTAIDMAMTLFLAAQPDVILIDMEGDEDYFLNFLQIWKQAAPRTQVIVQTNNADEVQKRNVLKRGAYSYLPKPVTPDALFEALNHLEPVAMEPVQKAAPDALYVTHPNAVAH